MSELCFIGMTKQRNAGTKNQARREGGKGKFSLAPRRLGGPANAQNTEKDVPDVVFLTSDMHRIHFRLGLW